MRSRAAGGGRGARRQRGARGDGGALRRAPAAVGGAVVPADGAKAFLEQIALGVRRREQGAELCPKVSAIREGGARRALAREIVVGALDAGQRGEALLQVEGAAGGQVDGGAERALVHFGLAGLAHGDGVEELGGEDVEVHRPAAVVAARGVGAAGGGHGFEAIDAGAGEAATQAAHGDLAAFAGVTVNRHARHALQRLGQVGVGELAQVFGADHVHHAGGRALLVQRVFQRGAQAGHHNGVQLVGLGRCSRCGRLCSGLLQAQRSGKCDGGGQRGGAASQGKGGAGALGGHGLVSVESGRLGYQWGGSPPAHQRPRRALAGRR